MKVGEMSEDEVQSGEILDLGSIVKGSADEKGRLKIPGVFKEYLLSSNDSLFFITTFDTKTIRIYPRSEWQRSMTILDGSTEPEARRVLFVAKVHGSATTIDKQGRILMSPELRKKLEIASEPVYFEKVMDHVEVYSKKIFDERLAEAERSLEADNLRVKQLGVR